MRTVLILSVFSFALVSQASADQTAAQLAKARGMLLDTRLADVSRVTLTRKMQQQVATQICGHPDQADPDIAFADIDVIAESLSLAEDDAEYLRKTHRALIQAATGRGSYPVGCLADYPDVHAATYFVDYDSYPAHFKRAITDDELKTIIDARVWGPSGDPNGRPFTLAELKSEWGGKSILDVSLDFCEEANRRIGIVTVEVKTGPSGEHNIHNLARVIGGSTIGLGWFPASTCNEHVGLHIDSTYRPNFQQLLGLLLHEFGHCLQGPHQFTNQDSHQEPLSYRFNNHHCVGYSTGEPVFGLPRAPSMALWTRLYGGEPVDVPWKGRFRADPKPPTPIPGDGNVKIEVGETIQLVIGGKTVTAVVASIGGDVPPTEPITLADRVNAAVEAIPDYPNKAKHRESLAAFYLAGAEAVSRGLMDEVAAAAAMRQLRELLLRGDLGLWSKVFELADSDLSLGGLQQVADGLTGSAALSPELKIIIDLIMQWLPDGRFKKIIEVVLLIIGGLSSEDTAAVAPLPLPAATSTRQFAAVRSFRDPARSPGTSSGCMATLSMNLPESRSRWLYRGRRYRGRR